MTIRRTTALLLSALIVTACSSEQHDTPHAGQVTSPALAATQPAPAAWGSPATGQGEGGNPLQITPVGVYYHPGDPKVGTAENGLFVAVAVKVTATGEADHVPPPMTGHGFYWKGR